MYRKLTDIRGIGEKVAEVLIGHYGSEEDALQSLSMLEFERLFSTPLSSQKLTEIAREVYAKRHGFGYLDALKTQEAKDIYSQILAILKGFVQTEYGRFKLGLFYPTKDVEELRRRQEFVKRAMEFVGGMEAERSKEIKELLKVLRPIAERSDGKRVPAAVVTEDRDLYEKLQGYSDLVDVFLLESPEDLQYFRDFDHVRYIQTDASRYTAQMEALPNADVFLEPKIEDIIPEEVLSFFTANRDLIIAGDRLIQLLGEGVLQDLGWEVDEEAFKRAAAKLEVLGDLAKSDERLRRFSRAFANLQEVVDRCTMEANKEIAQRVEKEILIGGREVLRMLEKGDIYGSLPPELMGILKEEAEKWEGQIAEALDFAKEDVIFSGIFSEVRYPLEPDYKKLREIEGWLKREKAGREFMMKRELASALREDIEPIKRDITRLLELDVLFAVGEFSMLYGAKLPDYGSKLYFKEGKHLLLRGKELRGEIEVQPISYGIERVTVLTGANSGGKTTLLETIAQIQIMAQCGLPVIAGEASAPLMDEIYYFQRGRGDASAGAFEALLKSFAELSKPSQKRRLVLADEIEAITEPGAAAKIISSLLEWFAEDESIKIVLVTHLGEGLRGMSPNIRIDGIEAEGLDEDLNLIVDRNPKMNKIARSTPELIVERLSRKEKSPEFYRYILGKFKKTKKP